MDLSSTIDNVIEKRKKLVPVLEKLEKNIGNLKDQIDPFDNLATNSDVLLSFQDQIQTFIDHLKTHKSQIDDVCSEAKRLAQRFNKKTINIGVAGKTRQGKSTLLQAISGLEKDAIPTSDGMPCTGAKSQIFHHNSRKNALIEIFTEDEFVREILHEQFNLLGIDNQPTNLADFAKEMPEPDPEKIESDTLYKTRFKWLKKVHCNIEEIQKIITGSPTIEIPLNMVPAYVTQHDEETDERNQYLSVKVANIYTNFPNHNVTGLGLVDLPGIEAGQAHDKRLIRSLEHEVDCVILVKLPPDTGAEWERDDHAVITLIQNQIGKSKLADWLFLVLNRKEDSSNQKQVEMLKNKPPEISDLKVLDAVCKSQDDVEQKVFKPILEHLKNNLERMDSDAINHLRNKIANILRNFHDHLLSMQPLVEKGLEELNERSNFNKLFKKFESSFKEKLNDMINNVRDEAYKNNISEQFEKNIHDICNQAREINNFVSMEKLKESNTIKGGWPGAIQEQMHFMRSALAKKFMDFDKFLYNISEKILKQIIDNAIPPEVKRLLEKSANDNSKSKDLVKSFINKLKCEKKVYSKLQEALKYALEFDFSYKTHFHYRVREEMKILDPINKNYTSDFIDLNAESDFERTSENVLNGLSVKLKEVVHCVRQKILKEMLSDPGNAMFAFAEELKDRFAWADGVMDDWDNFMYYNRSAIWPDEFNSLASESVLRKRWREQIEKTHEIIQKIEQTLNKEL